MSIRFEWQNPNRLLTQVQSVLRERGQRIANVPAMAVRRATFELLALVKDLAPKKTGTLARSIAAKVSNEGGVVVGRVGSHIRYAPFVEHGTGIYGPERRPIIITAKTKGGLFWGAYDQNGKPIIRRSVRIQGMKPRAPFGTAVAQFLPRYVDIIRQELAREAGA
jgi:hypothetical protein